MLLSGALHSCTMNRPIPIYRNSAKTNIPQYVALGITTEFVRVTPGSRLLIMRYIVLG